ncbi:hypothetical protein [Haloglycomyces albus]|uniref:hypothetical protein n=1 Tax=Haloglycomyces albus TaxID=526067 RepID=UPI00046D8F30|nr:hypothetical protein [Haloglycomyces albus]
MTRTRVMSPQTRLALRRGGRRDNRARMPLIYPDVPDRGRALRLMRAQRRLAFRVAACLALLLGVLVAGTSVVPAPWSFALLLVVPYPVLLLLSARGVALAEDIDRRGGS